MKGRHGRLYIHCRYIYEHYVKNPEFLSISLSAYTGERGGQSPFSPKPLGTKKCYTLVDIVVVLNILKDQGPQSTP